MTGITQPQSASQNENQIRNLWFPQTGDFVCGGFDGIFSSRLRLPELLHHGPGSRPALHCVNRIDILGLIGDPGPDPANSLVNCKFNLALELVPKNEFSKWNLAKLGSTFVSNSEEMLQAAGKLVPKYDPNGGCCKGGCISHLTITHHGPGSGNVAMSTDETEKFSLSEEYDINYTLENGKPLNNTQISNLLRNEAALATLSQLKKYLCRKSKVSIAQCGSEYGAGFNKYGTLKGRLEAFFGPNVTIETFDGLCGVRFGKPTTWWLDEGE